MSNIFCNTCNQSVIGRPTQGCTSLVHWEVYSSHLEQQLEMHDDDRDKLDVAEWLSRYKKVNDYHCHGCGRQYELPTHLTVFTCVCGHRCRLRHVGGINPDQAVIDAAMAYFGNERSAALAWIAEVVAGDHALHYDADEIRKMIRQEMDRWVQEEDGWRRK